MSNVPSKEIRDLVIRARNDKYEVNSKSGKYAMRIQDNILTLRHYSTIILVLDVGTGEYGIAGWSASDRDAINGVLSIYGLPRGAYIKDGALDCEGLGRIFPYSVSSEDRRYESTARYWFEDLRRRVSV